MNMNGVFLVAILLAASSLPSSAATLYVWQGSAKPAPPYATWETAAHVIQDAVDAAADGDTVLVTNGVYNTGGRPAPGLALTNRVLIGKRITVASVNGPADTIIVGYGTSATEIRQVPVDKGGMEKMDIGPFGSDAVRCVWVTNGAIVVGFTLTNGHTTSINPVMPLQSGKMSMEQLMKAGKGWVNVLQVGGGALIYERSVLSNCCVLGNHSFSSGGGIYGIDAAVVGCRIVGNSTEQIKPNGGAGGGGILIKGGIIRGCTVVACSATGGGGGILAASGESSSVEVRECLVAGNQSRFAGGGICTAARGGAASVVRCIIVSNTADEGGGINMDYGSSLADSTVADNTAQLREGGIQAMDQSSVRNTRIFNNICTQGAKPKSATAVESPVSTDYHVPTQNLASATLAASFLRAAEENDVDMVRQCISNGVNINATNDAGMNALMLAAAHGSPLIVDLLCRGGIAKDDRDAHDMTALQHAVLNDRYGSRPSTIDMLLRYGVQANATTTNGLTELMIVAAQGDLESVKRLLSSSTTDIGFTNHLGQSALSLAEANGRSNCFRLLTEWPLLRVQPKSPKAWALAASALLTQLNRGRHDTLPDRLLDPREPSATQFTLDKWWGIRKRADLLRTLKWLETKGHRTRYNLIMQSFSRMGDDEFKQSLGKADLSTIVMLTEVRTYSRAHPGQSINAWDYCRYISLCRWGYSAEFLTADEAWQMIMPIARRLQKRFSSWESLGRNYMHGCMFAMPQLYTDEKDNFNRAMDFLLKSKASPWTEIPWDLNLDEPSATNTVAPA